MIVTTELDRHIREKISYHKKLLNQNLAVEEYLACARHRDEIKRLKKMLSNE